MTMLRSIAFIKTIHTIIFVVMNAALAMLLYEVTVDRITSLTWVAIGLFLIEGIVLIVNGWKCPLTIYVQRLSATHGPVSDIYLPTWFADRIVPLYSTLLAVGLLILVIRLLD